MANPYYSGPPTDHFDGERFHSPVPTQDKTLRDILRWRLTSRPEPWPKRVATRRIVPDARSTAPRVTVVGHMTVLVQVAGLNILTDPVWSERASPVQFAGPKRVCPPAVAFADLPKIDIVLLSHNHYDHLDLATLARLVARDDPRILTPLGNDAIIRRRVAKARIETGDWWDRFELGHGVTTTMIPAQHWSSRTPRDARRALWCGFTLAAPGLQLFFAGDTGYGDGGIFHEVRTRCGPPDLALIPIGAYAPRWFMAAQHCNPDEAVQILLDLGARAALGLHWGVWQLSDEGREAPRRELAEALMRRQLRPERFLAAEPGEVWQP